MRKINLYFGVIIAACVVLAGVWVYQKYIRVDEVQSQLFKVERGPLQETVRLRGEVAVQKEYDLEFLFSGIVQEMAVAEGQSVAEGAKLIKLDTKDFELEQQSLEAKRAQAASTLSKLLAGATPEEVAIVETKVAAAQQALTDAENNLISKIRDAYTKSDDAVRNQADQLFSSPRTPQPQLSFLLSVDSQTESDLEFGRWNVERSLNAWKASLDLLSASAGLAAYTAEARANVDIVREFMDDVAYMINGVTATANLSQTTLDTWRAAVSTGRTNVNAAVANLLAAEEKQRSAAAALTLAGNELAYTKAGSRTEDIEAARAQVREADSQINIIREKIRKSTLSAPVAATVTKIWVEKGELFKPGQPAVTLAAVGHKITSDVSELEIGKIQANNGNAVLIRLDAFPGSQFEGKVASVEAKEIDKDGDKYYRINVDLAPVAVSIRSGMSADLVIRTVAKSNVLKVPEIIVYRRNGVPTVRVFDGNKYAEVGVVTGISDGEYIEIVSGLAEGQLVVPPAD